MALVCSFVVALQGAAAAELFRVVTYNVEGYLLSPAGTRPAKNEASRKKVRESIRAARPDVLALQEVGGEAALRELQSALAAEGLDLPHAEIVPGYDPGIQVAVLSRFPIVARRSHPKESFLLQGKRFRVSRGFGEVDIQVNDNYTFTLFTAHLKSQRASEVADEAELRLEEAKLLRALVESRLAENPDRNLLVAGDLNDHKSAPPLKELIGRRGAARLLDTRPAERGGTGEIRGRNGDKRSVTWTHFYAAEDLYSRIDYLLVSPGMAREWIEKESCVVAVPGWGDASDHRPVLGVFRAEER